MNLSPEERRIGKQNFDEAVGTTRRDFLKGSVLAGGVAAAGLGAVYFGYDGKIDDRLRVGIIGTGDEGNVLIGALNPAYIDVVAIADIRPYSIHRAFYGDWYSEGARVVRPGLIQVYQQEGWANRSQAEQHIKVYTGGYESLLDDANVEAVIIALPLHLHHAAALAAMRKGKHVLTEKLMAFNVAQCKEMARAAAAAKDAAGQPIVFAVGHQRHYNVLYDNAADQLRRGLIGDVHHIRAQWHRRNLPGSDSWQPPLPSKYMTPAEYTAARRAARDQGTEAELRAAHELLEELHSWESVVNGTHARIKPRANEIDEWKARVAQKRAQLADMEVDAAAHGYVAKELPIGRTRTPLEELIRWRLWDRTGGGLMAELGSHQLDAASIFISTQQPDGRKARPLSVAGMGGRSIFPADRDCDDHVYAMFEFPAKGYYKDGSSSEVADGNRKIVVSYSSINGNDFGGYGEIVFGTKGTLILEQEQEAMLFKGSSTTTRIEIKSGADGPVMDTYETGGGAAVAQAALGGNEVSRGYREEIEHWAWCIRNPAPEHKPRCTADVGLADAVIALVSNLAIGRKTRIEFQPEWFDIESDATPEGNKPRPVAELL
jgi:predicted dehydrogenase